MHKAMAEGTWQSLRLHVGVTLRALEMIPEDKLDSHPVSDMRTPKELAIHAFAYMRGIPAGIAKGNLVPEDCAEPVDQIKTKADLLKWCKESFEVGTAGFEKLTEEQITSMPETYFGKPFPGWVLVSIVYDEHLHHRGQLYVYMRALGIEPPFLWSFDESAAEFQPKTPV